MKNLINGMKPEFGNIEQIKILQKEQQERREKKELEDFYNNLSPGERYFQACVNIDVSLSFIVNLVEETQKKLDGRSPIDLMIDKTTGHEKAILKGFLLELKSCYEYMIPEMKISEHESLSEYQELLKSVNKKLKKWLNV